MITTSNKTTSFKIGRSAITGKFMPVNRARAQPNTVIVQHLPRKK